MSTNTTARFSPVVLGVDKLHGSACIDAVLSGLEAGHRFIDTAQSYGNEEEVGEVIQRSTVPRVEIFVTTKISTDSHDNFERYQEAYDSARGSNDRLRSAYVDLFLIHAPAGNADARRVTWQALERLVEEGWVRGIGVSNYGVRHVLEMKGYAKIFPPKVNQVELHLWCQQREIEQLCVSHGVSLQAYCSLVRNRKATHTGLCALAKRYSKSTQQILIRYSLQKGWMPVLRSGNISHIQANMDVYDFEIETADMAIMDSWDKGDDGALIGTMIIRVQEGEQGEGKDKVNKKH